MMLLADPEYILPLRIRRFKSMQEINYLETLEDIDRYEHNQGKG